MAYIGRDIRTGAFRQLDDISSGFDGSDTTHTMQVNSTNVSVGDVNQILLSLGGVIQKPGTDFTVSGSTLTFTTAPAANTSFFAILLGSDNGGTVTPTDGSVTASKLASDIAITTSGDISFDGGSFVFNESSADKDFRVEGNGNTHALFIRGSDDHVGINEDAPDCRFHIKETNDTSFSIDNFTNIDNSILKLENASTTNDAFVNMSFRTGDGMDLFFGGVQDSSDGNGGAFVFGRQDSTDVELLRLTTDGNANFASGVIESNTADIKIYSTDTGHCGIRFASAAAVPVTNSGGTSDGAMSFGSGAYRWATFYATSGSINTSDRNEKQDIEEFTDAEKRVAVAAKGLLRKYKFKDAVEKKGDDARTHFGIIAQDLEDAFTAEGLDASKYGMFCSDTWWETEEDSFETEEEAPEGATKRTRLGVRYSELLAFIIGGIVN